MACLATPLRFAPLLPAELSLAAVLKSGQSFRWHKFDILHATRADSDPVAAPGEEWALAWGDRTVCLRQTPAGIHYRALYPPIDAHTAYLADLEHDTTLPLLRKYFRLDTLLAPLYAQWAATDPHFERKVTRGGESLLGIRVLEQDPWEALVGFICSANNNISRITQMVNKLCVNLGRPMPHPTSFTPSCVHTTKTFTPLSTVPTTPVESLFSFPPPVALTPDSIPTLLRELGFGYRAPYINATALHLVSLPASHLASLHASCPGSSIEKTRAALLEFKGVGPKVADCIALFSLGFNSLVPVDTHVFQIAVRDYSFPASKTASLTPALHARVATRLQDLWGPYAGWTQQVLFFADLKSTPSTSPTKESPAALRKVHAGPVKAKWELELEELQRSPGKRRGAALKSEVVAAYPFLPTPASLPRAVPRVRSKKRKVEEVSPSPRGTKAVKQA